MVMPKDVVGDLIRLIFTFEKNSLNNTLTHWKITPMYVEYLVMSIAGCRSDGGGGGGGRGEGRGAAGTWCCPRMLLEI